MPDETPLAFAEAADVSTRMGRTLSETETATVTKVIETVTEYILQAVYKDADWAAELEEIPAKFREICENKAILALAVPAGLESQTETLGAYSHTERFAQQAGGNSVSLALNAAERAQARVAVRVAIARTVSTSNCDD